MGTNGGRPPPKRRLVMLVEPAPNPICSACGGQGVVEYPTEGGTAHDTCSCCRPSHEEPSVDDLVRHLELADVVIWDKVRDALNGRALS